MTKKHPLVGKRIQIVKGAEYLGWKGTIEYCDKCSHCDCYRIQFDKIGNNEKLKKHRKNLIFLSPTSNK